ncbi:hypothetical protein QNM99_10680 [Pseudomonas sp. PCH446]
MNLLQLLSFGDSGWGMALLKAAGMTVILTLAALLVGAVFGSLVAAAKLSVSVPCAGSGPVFNPVQGHP